MDVIEHTKFGKQTREPMFNIPPVVLTLAVGMLGIAIAMHMLDQNAAAEIVLAFGFVPADWASWFGIDVLTPIIDDARQYPDDAYRAALGELADYLKLYPGHGPVTLFSYAFLHGGFDHVAVNVIWLLAFGSPVARRLGPWRFLALFLISACGGALLHDVTHSTELVPLVGASGAIAGVMAGAVRFMFQPGEPLSGFAFPRDSAIRMPHMPLRLLVRDHRPLRFILLWIAVNAVTGLFGASFMGGSGTIAWEAHLGGFFAGLLAFSFLDPPVRLPDDEQLPLQERVK